MNCAFIERTIKPSKRDALNKSLALNCTKNDKKLVLEKREEEKRGLCKVKKTKKKTDLKKREKWDFRRNKGEEQRARSLHFHINNLKNRIACLHSSRRKNKHTQQKNIVKRKCRRDNEQAMSVLNKVGLRWQQRQRQQQQRQHWYKQ